MKTMTGCKIGKVTMKSGTRLHILPTREIGMAESLFDKARADARSSPVLCAGYFIVYVDGRTATRWHDPQIAPPSALAGGAKLLEADIIRFLQRTTSL